MRTITILAVGVTLFAAATGGTVWAQTGAATTKSAAASVNSAKAKVIRELLVVSGTEKAMRAQLPTLFAQLKQMVPDVPAEFWEKAQKRFSDTGTLVSRLVPIYSEHFTQADLEGMVAFYKTPLGQKLAQESPSVQIESYKVGSAWGQEIGKQVIADIEAEQKKGTTPAATKP